MIKKLGAGLSVWALTSSALFITKSGSSNDLVFGNYSDYISPDVAYELGNELGLRVDLFDYDHLVKERFEKGIYDIAITSTSVLSELKFSGAAKKLDWSRLLDKETDSVQTTTIEDAKKLFTHIVKDMSEGLLEYGIPYFVQKLGFYYRGNEIEGLKNQQKVSFKKIIEIISEDDRFKSENGNPKLGLIDDPRTVLSLARKVAGKVDVNPSAKEYSSSTEIFNDYQVLINTGLSSSKLGEKFLYMTPDSGPLVDALSSKNINGAFMYNGDGLFAASGGNGEEEISNNDFHYVELSENIFFLDFLTFSSKMPKTKEDKAYQMAKKLLFISKDNKEKPFEKESDDFKEMAVRNFDHVMYTPTLQIVYSRLEDYFKEDSEDSEDSEDAKKLVEKKKKILEVDKTPSINLENEYEKQLSPEKKSNMLIAYNRFKSLL